MIAVAVQYPGMTQVGKLLGNPLRGRRGHPSVGADPFFCLILCLMARDQQRSAQI